MARLFGTDGVRGVANRELTGELAYRLGRASVVALAERGTARPSILVGRDTRASGEFLEAALAAGICSAGGDAVLLGVCTTPAVAFLTSPVGAHAGVVISASHNPAEYNGIKLFGASGYKLPDEIEDQIQSIVEGDDGPRPEGSAIGRIRPDPRAHERYLDHLVSTAGTTLEGMRLVVDCANGAATSAAPEVLRRLGATVLPIHDRPDGLNINRGSGATNPRTVAAAVLESGADAGVAFDGDADRALFADARGEILDGDQTLAACALDLHERRELANGLLVTTVMANLGLRRAMGEAGIKVLETKVGDRYVLEEMLRSGAVLGGEQSGHVIFLRHATTGDGLLTAVQLLSLASRKGVSLAELGACMQRFPQVLESVSVPEPARLDGSAGVSDAIRAAEEALGAEGRVLVRASGTEPVVRVMVEAATEEEACRHAGRIAVAVRAALGA
ncbi:MAG: phosphoglucosamine mutase [Actinobacteria bacterium]|nr:phosphoglucosamine mutase [Actinomycetota bacterium]